MEDVHRACFNRLVGKIVRNPTIDAVDMETIHMMRKQLNLSEDDYRVALTKAGTTPEDVEERVALQTGAMQYTSVLRSVLAHPLTADQLQLLKDFREQHSLSELDHENSLNRVGWTLADFNRASEGLPRLVLQEYKAVVREVLEARPVTMELSLAASRAQEKYSVTPEEHSLVCSELNTTPEGLTAHQLPTLRALARRRTQEGAVLATELSQLETRFQENATKMQALVAKVVAAGQINQKKLTTTEKNLASVRNDMTDLDARIIEAKRVARTRERELADLAQPTKAVEAKLAEKNKELAELQQRVLGLSQKLSAVNTDLANTNQFLGQYDQTVQNPVMELLPTARTPRPDPFTRPTPPPAQQRSNSLAVPGGPAPNTSESANMPPPPPTIPVAGSRLVGRQRKEAERKDWGLNADPLESHRGQVPERESRELRLFRTACLAISTSVFASLPPSERVHVNIPSLYDEVKQAGIPVQEWSSFLTRRLQQEVESKARRSRVASVEGFVG